MKNFLEEFKKFALKGNVMDMAIGVIVGGAFSTIVAALTNSFINPLIAVFTGGADSEGVVIGGTFTINGVVFDYGAFITAVVNFFILAFILFCLLKAVNKMMEIGKKPEEPAEPEPEEEPKPTTEELLTEILAELKKKNGTAE